MIYKTAITLTIENGKTKSEHIFENENLSITRSTKLWIENKGDNESEFIEAVILCHETDKRIGIMSNYIIKTSEFTPVQTFRKYYVSKIDEDKQGITFEWSGY
jgi:hypothetical protein